MKRESIVAVILEELKKIRTSNGFFSDAGLNVFDWFDKPLEKDEYPALIVRDVSDKVNDSTTYEHALKIEVDIAVADKAHTPLKMREVISDVLMAFKSVENLLNFRCVYEGCDSLVEHKDSVYGGTRMEIDVLYSTRRWEQ